jgi:hypothetical protein
MATKQMNISFQVQNTLESTNTVTITLGGTTVYTGTLPETGPVITGGDSYTVTNINFDIDVPVLTSTGNLISTMAFSAAVTGATVQIEDITTNYNVSFVNTGTAETPVLEPVAGTDTAFALTNIVSQPQWNGAADLNRYNIEYNNGPIQDTGPGEVLIYSGETVAFNLAVANFNNTVPVGPLVP